MSESYKTRRWRRNLLLDPTQWANRHGRYFYSRADDLRLECWTDYMGVRCPCCKGLLTAGYGTGLEGYRVDKQGRPVALLFRFQCICGYRNFFKIVVPESGHKAAEPVDLGDPSSWPRRGCPSVVGRRYWRE